MLSDFWAQLAFGGAGLLLLNRLLTDLVVLTGSRHWPRVEGMVYPDAHDCPQPRLTVRYQVGDRTCVTHRVALFAWRHRYSKVGMSELRSRHPAGSPITVRHHPRSLALAIADSLAIPWLDLALLLLGIALCCAGVYGATHLQPPTFSMQEYIQLMDRLYGPAAGDYPIAISPQKMFAYQAGPIRFLRLPLGALFFWTLYRWFQAWFFGGRSPKWPLASGRIVSDEQVWVEGPRVLGIGRDRPQREVRYTYRAFEHRFESDRVTLFGNPTESFLAGDAWEGEEPIAVDAIVPVYHRPGKPHDSALVPGWWIARHGIAWLGWQLCFWGSLAAWVGDLCEVRLVP